MTTNGSLIWHLCHDELDDSFCIEIDIYKVNEAVGSPIVGQFFGLDMEYKHPLTKDEFRQFALANGRLLALIPPVGLLFGQERWVDGKLVLPFRHLCGADITIEARGPF